VNLNELGTLKSERAAEHVDRRAGRRIGRVTVDIPGDADRAVPKQVGHGLDMHTGLKPGHRSRVPQGVHAHGFDACLLGGDLDSAQ
jgi:hypothetical protein